MNNNQGDVFHPLEKLKGEKVKKVNSLRQRRAEKKLPKSEQTYRGLKKNFAITEPVIKKTKAKKTKAKKVKKGDN